MSNVINHYGILYGWQSEAIKKEQHIVFDDSPKAVESLLYVRMLRLRPGTLGHPFHFCMKLIFFIILQQNVFPFYGQIFFQITFCYDAETEFIDDTEAIIFSKKWE